MIFSHALDSVGDKIIGRNHSAFSLFYSAEVSFGFTYYQFIKFVMSSAKGRNRFASKPVHEMAVTYILR